MCRFTQVSSKQNFAVRVLVTGVLDAIVGGGSKARFKAFELPVKPNLTKEAEAADNRRGLAIIGLVPLVPER